jgi:acyl carrier protein
MKKNLIIKSLNSIFEENWDKLQDKKKLSSLSNWDSIKQVELVLFLEKQIKKKLTIKEIVKIKTVGNVNKLLKI